MQTKKLFLQLGQSDNMDEIPLHFNVSASKAVSVKGTQIIKGKTSGHKKYITLF